MKIVLVLLAVSAFIHPAFAEEESATPSVAAEVPAVSEVTEKSMKVQLNPFDFLDGHYRVEISNRISETPVSVGLMFEKTEPTPFADKYTQTFDGFAAGVHGSYFFSGSPFITSNFATLRADAYIGSYGVSEHLNDEYDRTDYQSYLFSALLGRQWHWDNFSVSASLGGAYNYSDSLFVQRLAGSYQIKDEEKTGVFFAVADISLGMSF